MLTWLIAEIFTAKPHEGLQTHWGHYPNLDWGWDDMIYGKHLCLLRDENILKYRNEILDALVRIGLAVKHITFFVTTRGGELRESYYLIAPEVIEFIRGYLSEQLKERLFPEELEVKHKLFHLFEELIKNVASKRYDPQYVEELCKRYDLEYEGTIRELEKLVKDNLLNEEEIRNRYFKPIINYILTPTGEKVPVVEERKIKEEKRVTLQTSVKDISVFLGYDEKTNEIFWKPLLLPNPHAVIVGTSGMGKTQTIKAIIHELSKISIPIFVIDFANEYGDVVETKLDPMRGIFINPLELLGENPLNLKYRIAGILKKIFLQPQADIQEGILREAIEYAYKKAEIREEDEKSWTNPSPSLLDVKEYLEKLREEGKGDRKKAADTLLIRLDPLFDLPVISNKTQIPLEEVVNKGATLFLKDLPTDEVKVAVAEFFLRHLWHYICSLGEYKGLRLYVIMDEAHRLAYEHSPVAYLLREGRKFGVGVILSSQQPDDFESKELVFQNASTVFAFCCKAFKHAETVAKQIGKLSRELVEEIQTLSQFTALLSIHGRELAKVRVKPFYERKRNCNQATK